LTQPLSEATSPQLSQKIGNRGLHRQSSSLRHSVHDGV